MAPGFGSKEATRADNTQREAGRFPTKLLEIVNEEPPFFIATRGNSVLRRLCEKIFESAEINALLSCAKQRARDQGLNEHGHHHALIVARNALEILRILQERGVLPLELDNAGIILRKEDLEAGVVAAGLLHDVGNAYHRSGHATYSVYISERLLDRALPSVYEDSGKRTALKAFVQSSILSHDKHVRAISPLFGIVRVADGLDIAEGRARWAIKNGRGRDIHKTSAAAIKKVLLSASDGEKPLLIQIEMAEKSGRFQIMENLMPKIRGSQLEEFICLKLVCHGEQVRTPKF